MLQIVISANADILTLLPPLALTLSNLTEHRSEHARFLEPV
ncbi:hypothetical protein AB4156_07310 [Cupriavidus sp. 2MCAB6]